MENNLTELQIKYLNEIGESTIKAIKEADNHGEYGLDGFSQCGFDVSLSPQEEQYLISWLSDRGVLVVRDMGAFGMMFIGNSRKRYEMENAKWQRQD